MLNTNDVDSETQERTVPKTSLALSPIDNCL